MRLFLIPVSTRRTLLYCQRLNVGSQVGQEKWTEKIQAKAAQTWAGWEKKESGWQKKVVYYGNYALRRIPYEEWGLKSVPPLSQRRKEEELRGTAKVDVVYPKSLIAPDMVSPILRKLATERQALHKRRMVWCFAVAPLTIPIGILPVIPNLPFFYLCYRVWSHWRALEGGKHLGFLLEKNLLTLNPSPIVDEVYADQRHPLASTPESTTGSNHPQMPYPTASPASETPHPEGESLLLSQANGKRMTRELDLPQLEVELERAIWQVETAIRKRNAELAKSSNEKTSTGDNKSQ